jgi:hypothetical protein
VTNPSLIHVVGGGDVLLDNASASTTLLVQGDDSYNAGVLTVAPDVTNAGVIQLDSTSGYWGIALAIQDLLDNTLTGTPFRKMSFAVTTSFGRSSSLILLAMAGELRPSPEHCFRRLNRLSATAARCNPDRSV